MTTQVTMDPGRLVKAERMVPFMNGRQPEKCIHGNEKGMGCCGYDELAVKPATTTPITFGSRVPARKIQKEEAEMGERPRIQAKPMPSGDIQVMPGNQPMPVQPVMGGRIPDGNFGVGGQVRSIFDVPRQAPRVESPQRPRILARAMGQEAPPPTPAAPSSAQSPPPVTPPPPPPPEKIEAVLKREAPPEGLTTKEAADLAAALTPALENTGLALAEGDQCVGIDDSSFKKASGLRDGLVRFATTAPDNARLQVDPADITLMEQVLDCSALYDAQKQAAATKTIAFVLGGLLVGGLILVLT